MKKIKGVLGRDSYRYEEKSLKELQEEAKIAQSEVEIQNIRQVRDEALYQTNKIWILLIGFITFIVCGTILGYKMVCSGGAC